MSAGLRDEHGSVGAAEPVPASLLLDEIRGSGISHVVCVPDTHQKTLLKLLAESAQPRLVTVCTEDEAVAINVGLYAGGRQPMLLIQNNGLFACMNALRGLALDARTPTFLLIGQFGRDVAQPSSASDERSVAMVEPTLDTWRVPYLRIESPSDVRNLSLAYRLSLQTSGPAAALIGAPTC